ncbi:MAG: DUF3108 domain-containing protein [Bacteroidetes bacterium]|nr:MAG: DUF3108 domain-containing protein [Bacteroidota bacterium]
MEYFLKQGYKTDKIMIKALTYICFVLLLIPAGLSAQDSIRYVEEMPFQRGESGKYRIYYDSWITSGISAGVGLISIKDEVRVFNGRPTFHLEVIGKSVGFFSWFFKVDDRFESFVDEETITPYHFIRRTKEGSYTYEDDVDFDQVNHIARSRRAEKPVPPDVKDIVSAFYYMRTIDFSDAEAGDEFRLDFYLDDSAYVSKIVFEGREVVETSLGKFRCLKFKPMVAQGEIFQEPYPMTLWVTDDRNKAPVLGKSAVIVGSVKIELVKIKGLKYPMEAKLD